MDIQDQDMDIHLQRFQMIQSSFSEDYSEAMNW